MGMPLFAGTERVTVPAFAALAMIGSLATAQAEAIGPDFADMVEQVLPAVVHVSVESGFNGVRNPGQRGPDNGPGPFDFNPFDRFGAPDRPDGSDQRGAPRAIHGSGSGFIIDEAGYVVTNNHVIDGAEIISVTLADGDSYDAELIGTDPSTDIALLKIDGGDPFPTVPWGDSEHLRIGNWVVAVGGPFGLSGTVTAGIVSATGRDLRAGPYDDYVQFDASINPGNSGGPVFDTSGRVIGVSTAIVSPSRGSVGIGFAVPAAIAQPVIESLMADGIVERGFLGVQIQQVTEELADALDLAEPIGALVAEVRPDSPADRAGVQVGDLIVAFDGHAVAEMRDLPRLVGMTEPGLVVDMDVLRDGATLTLAVSVGQIGADGLSAASQPPADDHVIGRIGLSVVSAEEFGLQDETGATHGVVVAEVRRNSPADSAGLRVGDLILAVGGRSIDSVEDLSSAIGGLDDDDEMVALLVERDGDRRFIALAVEPS